MITEANVSVGCRQAERVWGGRVEDIDQSGSHACVTADSNASAKEGAARVQFARQDAVEHRAGDIHIKETACWRKSRVVKS